MESSPISAKEQGRRPPFFKRRLIVSPRFQGELTFFFVGVSVIAMGALYLHNKRLLDNIDAFCKMGEGPSSSLCSALVENQSVQTDQTFLLIGLIVVLFNFLGGIFLSHRAAGPIYRLVRHIRSLRDGNTGAKLAFRKSDYFQEIVEALDENSTQST